MLADPTDAEREVLGAIAYQENETVLHTDASLMPRRRAAWASWNYHLTEEPAGRTTVTYHMNRLQSLDADREFLVTLNRTGDINPDRVIERSSPTRTRSTPASRSRRRRGGTRSAAGARTTAAPTGAGDSTRTGSGARCARARRWGRWSAGASRPTRRAGAGGVTASALYDGWVAHRRRDPVEHSLSLPGLDGAARPRGAARGARPPPAVVGPAARPRCAFAAPTTSGGPGVPLAEAARDLVEERIGARPGRPCAGSSRRLASWASGSTRSASSTCTARTGVMSRP